jgi:hypothetical protein
MGLNDYSMFWKREKESEKKILQMNEVLKKSFSNVRRDTQSIFQWLNYFYKKNQEQEQLIGQLQRELSYIPKTREELRKIIDEYYSFESIMGRMRDLNARVDDIAKREPTMVERIVQQPHVVQRGPSIDLSSIERRLDRLEQKKVTVKEKLVQRLTRNSKEYVKSMILSYIRKYQRISALKLKEIAVDEQNLCSKSSFYRLLEELESLEEVSVIKAGKEKHYMSGMVRKNA